MNTIEDQKIEVRGSREGGGIGSKVVQWLFKCGFKVWKP
jgi:hypothetical protein